jgi:mRNA interferase RelE/StbE
MGSYRIEWKHSATKELKRLPRDVIHKVIVAVEQLAKEPRPSGAKKLVTAEHTYRIRIGDYRIIYSIFESALVVEIIRVKHRKDVYRG